MDLGAKWGKSSLLPLEKEKELIRFALQRAFLGFGFSKGNFLRFAADYAKSEGIMFNGAEV